MSVIEEKISLIIIPLPYHQKCLTKQGKMVSQKYNNQKLFESFCLLTHPLKTHLKRTQLVHIFMHENFWTKSGNEIRYRNWNLYNFYLFENRR